MFSDAGDAWPNRRHSTERDELDPHILRDHCLRNNLDQLDDSPLHRINLRDNVSENNCSSDCTDDLPRTIAKLFTNNLTASAIRIQTQNYLVSSNCTLSQLSFWSPVCVSWIPLLSVAPVNYIFHVVMILTCCRTTFAYSLGKVKLVYDCAKCSMD